MLSVLSILFCLVAALYSMVGLGGGSTYNALLYLAGIDYEIFRPVALVCNLVVVTGGSILFVRAGHFRWRLLTPFLITSVPCAMFFASRDIPRQLFLGVLGFSLLVSGLRMVLSSASGADQTTPRERRVWMIGLPVGAALGSLAGLVSIGGGILLAPVLYFMRWGTAHQIAATASCFIFVNSLAGLAGHAIRLSGSDTAAEVAAYWPLFLAVLIGGQVGSRVGAHRLPSAWITRITAVLVLYVSVRMLFEAWGA